MRHCVVRLELNLQEGALADAVLLEVWQTEPLHTVDDDGVGHLGHFKCDFGPRPISLYFAYGHHVSCDVGGTHAASR